MSEHIVPKTVAVTDHEGGDWIPFAEFRGGVVHSIKFDNGQIWDCINGWRSAEFAPRWANWLKVA